MSNHSNNDEAMKYLYGDLSESERDKFEERLFSDGEFSLFVEDLENDLIDEYVRGELEFEQKRAFEQQYLTSESRHEKVAIARTLSNEVFEGAEISTDKGSGVFSALLDFLRLPNLAYATGLAAVFLILIVGGFWMLNQNEAPVVVDDDNTEREENIPGSKPAPVEEPKQEKPDEEVNASKQEPKTQKQDVVNQKAKPRSNANESGNSSPVKTPERKPKTDKSKTVVKRQPTVFAFSLMPPLRSSRTPVLKIPQSVKTVRLSLFDTFDAKYGKFNVELTDAAGATLWSGEIKASKQRPQKFIRVSIPGSRLSNGSFEIAVKGVTADGSFEDMSFYNFAVRKINQE